MHYTRRDVLKDVGLLTAAGITGCSAKGTNSPAAPVRTNYFASGVRIFFEGAWLFCGDPTQKNGGFMWALTVDAVEPHYFPYGRWTPSWVQDTDKSAPQLPAYDSSKPVPTVNIKNYTASSKMNDVYTAAQKNNPFNYLPAVNGNPYTPNLMTYNLRAVAIPIPTRIIPAGYNTGSSISDPKGHFSKSPASCPSIGVATTHIFEYAGASSLSFDLDPQTTVSAAKDYTGDYHFHTVPSQTSMQPKDSEMFSALLGILSPPLASDITLAPGGEKSLLAIGPDVPFCVSPEELEIFPGLYEAVKNGNVATCGGGGVGVGDGG
jgi:hypothetical protein